MISCMQFPKIIIICLFTYFKQFMLSSIRIISSTWIFVRWYGKIVCIQTIFFFNSKEILMYIAKVLCQGLIYNNANTNSICKCIEWKCICKCIEWIKENIIKKNL